MLDKFREQLDRNMPLLISDARKTRGFERVPPVLFAGIEDFATRGGKKIRPLLFLISYLGYTKKNKAAGKGLYRSALAVELLHDFLLVHDDVIDKSALRRGKPTLHRVYNSKLGEAPSSGLGADLAIVAGDIIFALAVEALMAIDERPSRKERALGEFTKAAALTGAGEFIDVVNGRTGIDRISRKDVFTTYDLKTARYTFISPLVMGAILGGSGEAELKKLSDLGLLLGRAFQILDDLLDMFSSRKTLGKPTLSDLGESKKTLLVWETYRRLGPKDRKDLKRFLEKEKKTHADLMKFRKLIKMSGAREYCENMVKDLVTRSHAIIDELKMKDKQRSLLKELLAELFGEVRR